jgi:hypothetical protein
MIEMQLLLSMQTVMTSSLLSHDMKFIIVRLFPSFPKDMDAQVQWCKNMGIGKENLPLRAVLCSDHFTPDCFTKTGKFHRGKRVLPTLTTAGKRRCGAVPQPKTQTPRKLPISRNLKFVSSQLQFVKVCSV